MCSTADGKKSCTAWDAKKLMDCLSTGAGFLIINSSNGLFQHILKAQVSDVMDGQNHQTFQVPVPKMEESSPKKSCMDTAD